MIKYGELKIGVSINAMEEPEEKYNIITTIIEESWWVSVVNAMCSFFKNFSAYISTENYAFKCLDGKINKRVIIFCCDKPTCKSVCYPTFWR